MDTKSRRLEIEKRFLLRNRMEREIKGFNELNELIKKERGLKIDHCENNTVFYNSNTMESRDDLEVFQNSSPTLEELSHHKFLLKYPCPAKHRKNPWIKRGAILM